MKQYFRKIAVALLSAMLLPVLVCGGVQAASMPDWSNDACYGSGNPLSANYKYQCTWYVWGRVRECLGIKLSGRTSQYVKSSVTGGYTDSPSTGSVAVYANDAGSILHVAYIEAFDGSTVTYSEGNNVGLGKGVQKYYTATLSLSKFIAQTKKWVGNGCTVLKYVPLVSPGTVETPSVTVSTGTADNITATNAKLHGSVSKPAGTWISSCGIYLGTTMANMTKRNTETVGTAANNKDGGTGFDIWYDLGSELSITLSQNTTYYYQVYAVCGNQEIKGVVKSFQTREGTVVYDQDVMIWVPAGLKVQGYQTVESTTNYRKIDPQAEEFTILATQYAVLGSGGRRFYYTDSNGYGMWFDDSSQYTVVYCVSSIVPEVTEVTVPVGETVAVRLSCSPSGYTENIKVSASAACPAVIEGNRILIQGTAVAQNRKISLFSEVRGQEASINVNIVDDSSPEISNILFSDTDTSGFTVSWDAADNYQLDIQSMQILAWSAQEGEEKAQALEITELQRESDQKVTCRARVNTADYGGAAGEYFVRIRAVDSSGNAYSVAGSVDVPCGHPDQERRDVKAAGCAAEGYTGDKMCVSCGEILEPGTVIPAAGHKWDAGRVTAAAAEGRDGVKLYTCTVCGETRTERVPAAGGSGTEGKPDSTPGTGTVEENAVSLKVSKLRVKLASSNAVKLSWGKVKGADGYYIYRAVSAKGTYSRIKTVSGTTFTNKKLKAGKTYYYKVVAFKKTSDGVSTGADSEIVSKKIIGKPATPKLKLTANASKQKIILSWNKIKYAKTIEIWRKVDKTGRYKKWKSVSAKKRKVSLSYKSCTRGHTYFYQIRACYTKDKVKVYSGYSKGYGIAL